MRGLVSSGVMQLTLVCPHAKIGGPGIGHRKAPGAGVHRLSGGSGGWGYSAISRISCLGLRRATCGLPVGPVKVFRPSSLESCSKSLLLAEVLNFSPGMGSG